MAATAGLSSSALPETEPCEIDLRLVLDCATDGIYCVDGAGLTTLCTIAFLRMVGKERESDVVGKSLHEIVHHSHPDGSSYRKENCPIYRTARDGTPAHIDNEVFFRSDGTSFPVEYWVRSILRDGKLSGAVCTVADITERKRTAEQAELLLNEVHHRVKNIVGTIQAIATQTFRTAPQEERRAFSERIRSLANAYDLLVIQDWEGAIVSNLVSLTLAPFQEKAGDRFEVSGPAVSLNAAKSLLLVMALHELGTNAAKYGALSTDTGRVEIRWDHQRAEPQRLGVEWRETGGPPVQAPCRRGFGSILIEHGLQGEQGGARIEFAPSGVVCTLEIGL
jgi:PAS domain S-box-containing protein